MKQVMPLMETKEAGIIKPTEETKELIITGKIPVEKLEETMEKILGIEFNKEEGFKSEDSYSNHSDHEV